MTMRLFEAEERADSSTGCVSGLSLNTQASNFSFFMRTGTSSTTATLSIPTCLTQSERMALAGSFRSTNATRAEVFLLTGILAAGPTVFSISADDVMKLHSGAASAGWQRIKRTVFQYKRAITKERLDPFSDPQWFLGNDCCRDRYVNPAGDEQKGY